MKRKLLVPIFLLFASATIAKDTFVLPPKGIRDTAFLMLKEFVQKGNTNLGFSGPADVTNAKFDHTYPVSFYYVAEDSLLYSNMLRHIFIDMNKVMYPVFVGDQIRASITFEVRNGRWKPTAFEDSTEIVRILRIRKQLKLGKGKTEVTTVAYLPSSHLTIYIEGNDLKKGKVTSPNILDTARNFEGPLLDFLDKPRVSMKNFLRGYRYYLLGTTDKVRLQR
jgi:hypothetical protein